MWLIGRSYSAQIERRSGQTSDSDGLYARVAVKIAKSGLDSWLDGISHITRIYFSNIDLILATHGRFVDLLQPDTKINRRSFASKYLHFHKPMAFFIFDSRAVAAIRQKPGRKHFPLPSACTEADPEYAAFALRCLAFRNAFQRDLTPRELDDELLKYSPVAPRESL